MFRGSIFGGRDRINLGLRVAMPPVFGKIKNKNNILSPLSLKKFTSWPMKSQKWKIYQIIPYLIVPRISRITFSQTFGQFTNLDNKKNLQNNSLIWIIRKIFGHYLNKNNYNKSITNPSKTNNKNPIAFT